MIRLLREPLVRFFLIGGAIFGLYALVDDTPPPVAANALVITDDDALRLVAEFEATWRRPPTVAELDFMIGDRVREEVYVREALALGLDRDDAVIRRRLQMKMEFLTESGAETLAPDDATLGAHLAAHPERFTEPPLVAFEQVLLEDRVNPEEATLVAARLNAGGVPGGDARPTLLPRCVPALPGAGCRRHLRAGLLRRARRPAGRRTGPARSSPRSAAISSA